MLNGLTDTKGTWGKECCARVSRRLWGGGGRGVASTSLKTTAGRLASKL